MRKGDDDYLTCTINGCQNIKYKTDICRKHYHQIHRDKKCEVCDSTLYVFYNKDAGMMLCNRHAQQIRRRGKILTRTLLTPNEFIVHTDDVEIVLFDINSNIAGSTYIDKDDYEKCKKYKWRLNSMGYAVAGDNSEILLHRYVMSVKQDESIDHMDKNKLNNKKSNLRIASQELNAINKSMQSNNTSGVTGVNWNKEKSGWDVQLRKKDFKFNKRFKIFDKAVQTRIIKESKYFKEYSPNCNHNTNTIQLTYLSHDDNKKTYIEADMEGNIIKFEKMA